MGKDIGILGPLIESTNIHSSLRPFFIAPDYKVPYPRVVIDALCELYLEYNKVFDPILQVNREWKTDYQYARAADGSSFNFAVQIDMTGLDKAFLKDASAMSVDEVQKLLRRNIFEIENSVAMYHIFGNLFEVNDWSIFKSGWRAALKDLRNRYLKPIALLACTHQKFEEIRAVEFGKTPSENLSNAEVQELSGFDCFFGPNEFRAHLDSNNGECGFLLYVRSSDPISKLKRPEERIKQPLLGDPETRRIIKMNSITLNIDDPGWLTGDPRCINDTKAYMIPMGMAFSILDETDVYSPEFATHLKRRGSYADFSGRSRISPTFAANLKSLGLDPDDVASGRRTLRFKPMKGAYGCYGHVNGQLSDADVRRALRKNLRTRGPYIVQQEIRTPSVIDTEQEYAYMDRIFLSLTGGRSHSIGGFRLLMPLDSSEVKSGRNHGSQHTIWVEIERGL